MTTPHHSTLREATEKQVIEILGEFKNYCDYGVLGRFNYLTPKQAVSALMHLIETHTQQTLEELLSEPIMQDEKAGGKGWRGFNRNELRADLRTAINTLKKGL